jgi:hypothetical protein
LFFALVSSFFAFAFRSIAMQASGLGLAAALGSKSAIFASNCLMWCSRTRGPRCAISRDRLQERLLVELRKFPGCDGAEGVVVRRLPDPKAPINWEIIVPALLCNGRYRYKRHGDPAIKSSIGPEMPRARSRHAARRSGGARRTASTPRSLKDQNARSRAAPGPFPCAGTD